MQIKMEVLIYDLRIMKCSIVLFLNTYVETVGQSQNLIHKRV